MSIYLCNVCNIYVYNEKKGDPKLNLKPGTSFESIKDSFRCPICNAKKESFRKLSINEEKKAEENYELYIKKTFTDDDKITLINIREKARELLKGICAVNRACDGEPDRLCIGQSYGRPIGFGGVGKGLSFTNNVRALDKIKLKTRLISNHKEPDLSTIIFGEKISIPIMSSSLSGVKASMGGVISEFEFATNILQGAKDAGTIGWIGNTCDEGQEKTGVNAVKKVGLGIPIFKPQSNNKLIELIKIAEKANAVAVGIDLDGVGSTNWEKRNKPVYRKSIKDLRELVDSTDKPFIAKGIMCIEDANYALDSGVKGIDVSNHGGRALDSTCGVAEVLPDIVKALKGKITITAGGGIRTGFDVLKMLALGANSVLIGRDIARASIGGGAEGVKLQFEYLKSELRRGMILTSCNYIDQINKSILD
jgi:isopentenyl diphosphate isomerase/L-lactate dehydrogenase-like FMN-dependent dehydrogenase/rubredoxin